MTEPDKEADKKVDIYRDTPLRYMGYCNEVGESFKAFLPKWAYLGTYTRFIKNLDNLFMFHTCLTKYKIYDSFSFSSSSTKSFTACLK